MKSLKVFLEYSICLLTWKLRENSILNILNVWKIQIFDFQDVHVAGKKQMLGGKIIFYCVVDIQMCTVLLPEAICECLGKAQADSIDFNEANKQEFSFFLCSLILQHRQTTNVLWGQVFFNLEFILNPFFFSFFPSVWGSVSLAGGHWNS